MVTGEGPRYTYMHTQQSRTAVFLFGRWAFFWCKEEQKKKRYRDVPHTRAANAGSTRWRCQCSTFGRRRRRFEEICRFRCQSPLLALLGIDCLCASAVSTSEAVFVVAVMERIRGVPRGDEPPLPVLSLPGDDHFEMIHPIVARNAHGALQTLLEPLRPQRCLFSAVSACPLVLNGCEFVRVCTPSGVPSPRSFRWSCEVG